MTLQKVENMIRRDEREEERRWRWRWDGMKMVR